MNIYIYIYIYICVCVCVIIMTNGERDCGRQFPSSGRYATHWLGDNYSSFDSMRGSIAGMLAMK